MLRQVVQRTSLLQHARWLSATTTNGPLHPAFGRPGRFLEHLSREPVICAEGYLFELERRGYVKIGPFVPEVVLTHPEAVKQLHREFLRAGSDIMEAFTYYGHRSKMKLVGKEHLLEDLNRGALRLAQEVAMEKEGDEPALVAGNVCNTTMWADDGSSREEVRSMFREQIGWAKEHGVDLVVGETFDYVDEAVTALEEIQAVDLPSVITLAIHHDGLTRCGLDPTTALKEIKAAGADVVGLNCARGPETMLSVLEDVCGEVPGPIAALPVMYTTSIELPTFQSLSTIDKKYTDLDPFVSTRFDASDFTQRARELGVSYFGVCCGGAPHHVRAMAQALGKDAPSSEFDPDLSMHFAFGNKEGLGDLHVDENTEYGHTGQM